MNRYWVALTKGPDQVIVRVDAVDETAARAVAERHNPGYEFQAAGLLRKAAA